MTKAAAVSGTSDAESRRSKAQWYDPCARFAGGNVVASFTLPRRIARRNVSGDTREESGERTAAGDVGVRVGVRATYEP